MKRFVLVLISIFFFIPSLTQAGKLSDFEESATSNGNDDKTAEPQREEADDDDDDDDDDRYYYEVDEDESVDDDYEVNSYPSKHRAQATAAPSQRKRSNPKRDFKGSYRKPGTTSLRLDVAYQNVDSDVEAVDFRIELGLDWAGLNYSETNYKEDTGDELELSYIHAVYRHQFSSQLEWHVGGGGVYLGGAEDNTGASITSPLIYQPLDWLAVEFRPTWSTINDNSIKDYDLGIHLGYGVGFLKVGYRWVESGDSNLDAAYIGASFRF